MSWWYKVLYQMGVTPWEEDPTRGPVADQLATLFAREEEEREPPYGPALDLGCGTGIWSVALAQRGWNVTGIDVVPKAVRQARERAVEAGVDARFFPGDVASLETFSIEPGIRFVLDLECFNHLDPVQRRAVGRGVAALTSPRATMLLLVWAPGRRGPLPPGASREDIETAFPEWDIVDEVSHAATSDLPWWVRNADLRFYRLRRVAE